MKKWLLQTSTIGGLISLAITGIQLAQSGGDWMTIALGVLSALLLMVNDGKFLKGLTSKNSGGGAAATIVFACLAIGNSGCAALQSYISDHPEYVDQFKNCAVECGAEAAGDALACPINGGSFRDIVDKQVATGLAKNAGACILGCLAQQSVNVITNVCKPKG